MRPVQYFTDEYLELCRGMKPEQVLEFLDGFRKLQEVRPARSKLISLKVPEPLLDSFRAKAGLRGIRYQTLIKKLMSDWVENG